MPSEVKVAGLEMKRTSQRAEDQTEDQHHAIEKSNHLLQAKNGEPFFLFIRMVLSHFYRHALATPPTSRPVLRKAAWS